MNNDYKVENSLFTECRNTAIKENLPLFFIYYEETGVFEVYVTKTKELFEKRHCIKYLSEYRFKELAMQYLDDYSEYIRREYRDCDCEDFELFYNIVNSDAVKFNKIKEIIGNWAVDDDEHELLEKISDIVNGTEEEDEQTTD